jgi:hypothetical protein
MEMTPDEHYNITCGNNTWRQAFTDIQVNIFFPFYQSLSAYWLFQKPYLAFKYTFTHFDAFHNPALTQT